MRIAATFLIGAALAAGCQDHSDSAQPAPVEPAKAAAAPAATAKPIYFEVNGTDGKTYVFGSVESMVAYHKTSALPPVTEHMNKGTTVYVETAAADRLGKEYDSEHK